MNTVYHRGSPLTKVEIFKDQYGAPEKILIDGVEQKYVEFIGWKYNAGEGLQRVQLGFHANLVIHEHSEVVASTD